MSYELKGIGRSQKTGLAKCLAQRIQDVPPHAFQSVLSELRGIKKPKRPEADGLGFVPPHTLCG